MTPEGPLKPYDFGIPVLTIFYEESLIIQCFPHPFCVLFADVFFSLERETPSRKE